MGTDTEQAESLERGGNLIAASLSYPRRTTMSQRYVLGIAITCAFPGPASADRTIVEKIEAEARSTHDPAKLDACGLAYLDARAIDPSPERSESLYAAAACFDDARSFGAAMATYDQAVAIAPNSKFAHKAILRTGQLAARIGRFEVAAQRLEAYTKKYTGDRDARDALADAIAYRELIHDDAMRVTDTRYFIETFRMKNPREATVAAYRLLPIYERRGRSQAIDALAAFLPSTSSADADLFVIASSRLGVLQWEASCPGQLVDDVCVRPPRPDATPRCHAQPRLEVVARTPSKDAERALRAAIDAYERRPSRDPGVRDAYAAAKLRLADRALESYLAVAVPSGLNFDPGTAKARDESLRRLASWIDRKAELATAATDAYQEVIALGDVDSAIAAAARLGQLNSTMAGALRSYELSKTTRGKDKAAAVCEELDRRAEPLLDQAKQSYRACLARGAELARDDAWTALCARELAQLDPSAPARAEMLGPLVPTLPAMIAPAGKDAASALARDGVQRWRDNKRDAAIAAWESAIASNPKLAAPHVDLALALLGDPGKADEVEQHLRAALALDDDYPTIRVAAAIQELGRGHDELASYYVREAETRHPHGAAYLTTVAIQAAHRGDWPAALAKLEQAMESSSEARYDLAIVELRTRRYAKAREHLAEIRGSTYELEVARGVAARGVGRTTEAIEAYRRAIALDSTRREAHRDLGVVYLAAAAAAADHGKQQELRALADQELHASGDQP
jgi:tetratricopeptide (TPR) repeat protein